MDLNNLSATWIVILVALALWELLWKGLALWKAARNDEAVWFTVLLVINSAGLLSMLYLLIKKSNVSRMNPTSSVTH